MAHPFWALSGSHATYPCEFDASIKPTSEESTSWKVCTHDMWLTQIHFSNSSSNTMSHVNSFQLSISSQPWIWHLKKVGHTLLTIASLIIDMHLAAESFRALFLPTCSFELHCPTRFFFIHSDNRLFLL